MNLSEWAGDAWGAFASVGGTEDMYEAGLYDNTAQAYYAGQVWAYNRILFMLGLPHWPVKDYGAFDREWEAYV